MDTFPAITLTQDTNPEALATVHELFLEYSNNVGVNLEFQDFKNELATLPGDYAEPRGAILVAWVDGAVAGCCALRPLDSCDYPNAAEMKRLYVRKAFRGFGLGQQLAEATLDLAHPSSEDTAFWRAAGRQLLDCLDALPVAQRAAFLLHHEDGNTVEDLAKRLAVPFEAVKSRLRYALQKLRGCMQAYLVEMEVRP